MKKNSNPENFHLEEKLKTLEEISEMLDEAEKPIDELLSLYEKAVAIAEECRRYLESAKLKVETLGKHQIAENQSISEDM